MGNTNQQKDRLRDSFGSLFEE